VIVDGAAAHFLSSGEVVAAVVGADRIARNGDCANKIGTLGLAAAAATFGVPLYIAAPHTTFDPNLATGKGIPIELRSEDEIRKFGDREIVPAAAGVRNPVFDVTPARLVNAIITETGVYRAPYRFE
jgi:methylthioribose-1-phosphate isomerase